MFQNNLGQKMGRRFDPFFDPYGETSGNYRTAPERTFPIVFAASFFATVVTWAQASSVRPALDTPAFRKPFCPRRFAEPSLRKRAGDREDSPARFSILCSMCGRLSGSFTRPVGDENTYLLTAFSPALSDFYRIGPDGYSAVEAFPFTSPTARPDAGQPPVRYRTFVNRIP